MTSENAGGHPAPHIRIIQLSIAPGDPRPLVDAPLVIVARLDPPLDQEEQQWWMERLGEHVKVRAGSGSASGSGPPFRLTAVHVEAPPDQVEAVARRLLTAIDEANAAYPDRYPVWRREHDERIAEERLREQRRFAAQQAILDGVMDEYRSNHQ
jgi:hypothetical protein